MTTEPPRNYRSDPLTADDVPTYSKRQVASLRADLAAAEARAAEAESYSNADTETAAQFATRAFAAEAERDRLRGELREVREQIAAVLDECERADDWMRRQYVERNGHGAVPNALEVAALSRLVTAKVRELLWPSPSTVTLNATQPGVDEHSDSRNARRYDRCDNTCTVDCGHCKGQGPPVAPEPAEPERRTAICGHENFAQGFCVVDGCANDLHKRGPSSAATPAEAEPAQTFRDALLANGGVEVVLPDGRVGIGFPNSPPVGQADEKDAAAPVVRKEPEA